MWIDTIKTKGDIRNFRKNQYKPCVSQRTVKQARRLYNSYAWQ